MFANKAIIFSTKQFVVHIIYIINIATGFILQNIRVYDQQQVTFLYLITI